MPSPLPVRDDHACWTYDDPVAFRQEAVGFLRAGIAAGERLEYLGSGAVDDLRAELAEVEGFAALQAHGLVVRSLDDQYGTGPISDPTGPVEAYLAATDAAVADGSTGLRVVAEATALVRTPAQREAFARYEHLVDRAMADRPFTAMCAYDRGVLGPRAADELACLHPHGGEAAPPFRWCTGADGDLHLAGQVDSSSQDLFEVTVGRTMPLQEGTDVVVDARDLGFIDHRGLLTVDRHARAAGTAVTVRSDAPVVHRLAGLLDLAAVRVERS